MYDRRGALVSNLFHIGHAGQGWPDGPTRPDGAPLFSKPPNSLMCFFLYTKYFSCVVEIEASRTIPKYLLPIAPSISQPSRLVGLLRLFPFRAWQAITLQTMKCVYHNTPDDKFALTTDHSCELHMLPQVSEAAVQSYYWRFRALLLVAQPRSMFSSKRTRRAKGKYNTLSVASVSSRLVSSC